MEHRDYNLQPIWDSLMRLYKVFKGICRRHNFRYFADGGTMLGAVRHKGFIPWDDDMDLIMPREDYDKFMSIAKQELPEDVYLSAGDNKYGLYPYFMKLVDDRAGIAEEIQQKSRLAGSIPPNIDIFPLDATTSSRWSFKIWHLRWRLWHLCEIYRFPEVKKGQRQLQVKVGKVVGPILSLFYPPTNNHNEMLDVLADMERHRAPADSEYVGNLTMQIPTNHWKRAWFADSVDFDFCGDTIPVPVCYDDYLRCQYGDYMKLPPVEKRVPAHRFI